MCLAARLQCMSIFLRIREWRYEDIDAWILIGLVWCSRSVLLTLHSMVAHSKQRYSQETIPHSLLLQFNNFTVDNHFQSIWFQAFLSPQRKVFPQLFSANYFGRIIHSLQKRLISCNLDFLFVRLNSSKRFREIENKMKTSLVEFSISKSPLRSCVIS